MTKRSNVNREIKEIDPRNMPPGTRVYIYLRHSPGDEQTLESQQSEIEKYCKQKGWIIIKIFRDLGISGSSTENRTGFEEMIYLSKQESRQGDLIVIWDYSRFARNMDHAQLYRAELRHYGWQIYSMRDEVPTGPMSRLYEVLIDWKNEQFLIDLRANTRRGLRFIAERNCVPVGQIAKGYNHRQEQLGNYKDGRIRFGRKPEIDPEVAPLVIRAFELKAQGAPHDAIATQTGLYGAKSGSWDSMFRNRAYIGEFVFAGQVFATIYPLLISVELFDSVQERMPKVEARTLSGKHHPRRKNSTFILANVGVCSHCGSPMEGKRVGKYRYYVCCRHNERVEYCPKSALIPADALEEQIISLLASHVLSDRYLAELLVWTNDRLNNGRDEYYLRLKAVKSQLIEAEHGLEKYTRNFGMMERPTLMAEKLLHEQEDRVAQLLGEAAHLQYELDNSRIEVNADQITRFVQDRRSLLDQAEPFDLRALCEAFLSRIRMSREECQVEVQFPEW